MGANMSADAVDAAAARPRIPACALATAVPSSLRDSVLVSLCSECGGNARIYDKSHRV